MTKFRMVALSVALGSVFLVVAGMTPSEPDTTIVERDLAAAACSSEHSEPNVYRRRQRIPCRARGHAPHGHLRSRHSYVVCRTVLPSRTRECRTE